MSCCLLVCTKFKMQRAFLCAPSTDMSLYRLHTPYLVGSVSNVSACHKKTFKSNRWLCPQNMAGRPTRQAGWQGCQVCLFCSVPTTDALIFLKCMHRYLKNIDCSSFVMCPLLAPHLQRHFWLFWLQPITVLMRQTRQAVCAINQSIFVWCLWFEIATNHRHLRQIDW